MVTYVVWHHLSSGIKCGYYNHCYLCIVENGILYEVDKNMKLTIRAFKANPYFDLIKSSLIKPVIKEIAVQIKHKRKDKIKIIQIITALWHTFHIVLQMPYKVNYSPFSCVETTKAFLGIMAYHIHTPERLYEYLFNKGFIVGDLFGGATTTALKDQQRQQKKQLQKQKKQLQNEKSLLEKRGTGYNPLFDFGKK